MSFKYKDQAIADSNDIYSTDEVRIGTWINGKPLYRRSFSVSTPANQSNGSWDSIHPRLDNIDDVITIKGILHVNSYYFNTPIIASTGSACRISYEKALGVIIYNEISNYTNKPLYVILEYTKTTDQPEI